MFNDEDLKRLKAYHKGRGYYIPTSGPHVSLWDILARLDAAEKVCAILNTDDMHTSTDWIKLIVPAVESWRKSAGKETK